jgi:hypothetical protein
VLFEDSRAHFVFSDKTGLILHPRGDCFTYFAKNGYKTRQLTSYAVNSSAKESAAGSLDKLLIALQFYNTYSDEPNFTRDELLDDVVTRLYKLDSCSWPGADNLGEYISQDTEGNIHLVTTDHIDGDDDSHTAELILSSNGFQLTVTYLLPLLQKAPEWVETDNLNMSVASGYSATSKRMKMAYQHIRVTQLFTIFDFPLRWSYPVSLLMYLRRSILQQDLVIQPSLPSDFDDRPDLYYEELVVGKEYQTRLPVTKND